MVRPTLEKAATDAAGTVVCVSTAAVGPGRRNGNTAVLSSLWCCAVEQAAGELLTGTHNKTKAGPSTHTHTQFLE